MLVSERPHNHNVAQFLTDWTTQLDLKQKYKVKVEFSFKFILKPINPFKMELNQS